LAARRRTQTGKRRQIPPRSLVSIPASIARPDRLSYEPLELDQDFRVEGSMFALAINWDAVLLAIVTGLIILCTMISLILKEIYSRR
jgi:hypothetical protein